MSKREEKLLDTCFRYAVDVEEFARAKVAAMVAIKGTIISFGHAHDRTHPLAAKFAKNEKAVYLHAEVHAIVNALNHLHKDEFKRATLYVARAKRTGPQGEYIKGIAKPCPGCQAAIAAFNFKNVVYTDE